MEMLGAITGLIGAGLQASSNATSQEIAMMNLMFQKQQAAKQERLATATRTDAFGNEQFYDAGLNKWVNKLTPTQSQIIHGGEQEQLRQLTEDATRKRELERRQEQRSLGATRPYNEAVVRYQYDQPQGEASIRNDLETLMLNANRNTAKQNQDTLAREALRLGRGADIPRLIKSTDDELQGQVANAMLQARQGATQEASARRTQHEQVFLPEIAKWAAIMDDGGAGGGGQFSNTPQQLDAMQGQQESLMMQALKNASSEVGSAYKNLGAAAGKSVDLSGIKFPSLGNLGGGGKSKSSGGQQAYSLTNTSTPWDAGIPWGNVPDYLDNMQGGGGFLF
jgi:hypothetical protein